MTLPKVIHPTKKIKIPSLDVEIDFEPFTTADEKAIISMERNVTLYEKSKIQREILQKCCRGDASMLQNLSAIETTFLFLQLRKISVGGTLDFISKCPKCDEEIQISVDIDLIQFDATKLKPLQFTISTSDGPYIVICTQFTVDDLQYIDPENPSLDDVSVVIRTMSKPDGNDIIELTREEKLELFNQLSTEDTNKIVEYINNAPALEKVLDIECSECGHKFKGDLKDFFI